MWGAWHILGNGLWASGITSGELSLAIFLPAYLFTILVGQLPAFRVLMLWVYDRTGESLLVAMLMHASLTACSLILTPPATGVALLTYCLALAAAWWVVVAAVAVVGGWHPTRQLPLRRRVA